MEKEKYTDREVKIHPSFIKFVLARPWLHNVNTYQHIRSYEKAQRMKCLFENENGSWFQTKEKLYKDIRTNLAGVPSDLTDDDITIILKDPLFDDTNNTISVFMAAERIVPSILDYDKYNTRNINAVRELVIKDIFLSLNGEDKDYKSEFCLMMEKKYKNAFDFAETDKCQVEKEPITVGSAIDILNEYVSDASSEGVAPSFTDGVAYRGENPPSPFVIAYGDRWKMDGEEEVPEECWELLKTVDFKPNVLHIIKFDTDKEVLKKWFALNGDTKKYTYFLHKDDYWFKLSPIDNKFDF